MSQASAQQRFVQLFLHDRILLASRAVAVHKDLAKDVQGASFPDFLASINQSLRKYDLEISSYTCPDSRDAYLAIVNTNDDALAQLNTQYSVQEISYLKLLLEAIVKSPDDAFDISWIEALNLTRGKKTEIEAFLGQLVQDKWLAGTLEGRLRLSVRLIMELRQYLRSEFPDEIVDCNRCQDIVTKGRSCRNILCRAKMHEQCFEEHAFLQRASTQHSPHALCPTCSGDF